MWKLSILMFIAIIIFLGCSKSIAFVQTPTEFQCSRRMNCPEGMSYPEIIESGESYIIRIPETGELIYLDRLNKKLELNADAAVAIAKLRGVYFIYGAQFGSLLRIKTKSNNKASVKLIKLPNEYSGWSDFQFELQTRQNEDFFILTGTDGNGKESSFGVDFKGKIYSVNN